MYSMLLRIKLSPDTVFDAYDPKLPPRDAIFSNRKLQAALILSTGK